jgi:RNA polymerase sigma-70 factor (ECF subfamily)
MTSSSGRDPLSDLMARYQAGDFAAFEEIYRETVQEVGQYLARHAAASDCSDLVQEVYLRVHQARRAFRQDLPFRPWLFAISHHVALMAARRRRRKSGREVQVDDYPEPAASALEREPDILGQRQLSRAIQRLPPEQREVLRLAHVEDLTSIEIGRLVGATPGAVKVRLHRARLRLRGWLGAVGR